jgi:hypothetical protein
VLIDADAKHPRVSNNAGSTDFVMEVVSPLTKRRQMRTSKEISDHEADLLRARLSSASAGHDTDDERDTALEPEGVRPDVDSMRSWHAPVEIDAIHPIAPASFTASIPTDATKAPLGDDKTVLEPSSPLGIIDSFFGELKLEEKTRLSASLLLDPSASSH